MGADLRVEDLKLSFIWVETIPEPLFAGKSPAAPLSFILNEEDYVRAFELALLDHGPGESSLPWKEPMGRNFWRTYLGWRSRTEPVPGKAAWKLLTPFRARFPFFLNPPVWWPGKMYLEGFVYPHAVAAVFSAEVVNAHWTLDELVEKGFMVHGDKPLELITRDKPESLFLHAIAGRCLDALRARFASLPRGAAPADPLTTLTVFRLSGPDAHTPVESGGPIHQALAALTSWKAGYPNFRLDALPSHCLRPRSDDVAGHFVYARRRARALWHPIHPVADEQKNQRQSKTPQCYHKNLVYASMQVESLCGLMDATARMMRDSSFNRASYEYRACVTNAARVLGPLYGGGRDTYRSRSIRAHIDENGWVPDIDQVRAQLGVGPPLRSDEATWREAPAT